jgi:hypothetical protein
MGEAIGAALDGFATDWAATMGVMSDARGHEATT